MKCFGLWVLVGVALALLVGSCGGSSSTCGDLVHHLPVESATVMLMSRKLKENHYDMHVTKNKGDIGNVEVEDYPHFDPAPSSKAAIRYAPIEHGTPLMPYVPKPSPPPGHPKHNGLA